MRGRLTAPVYSLILALLAWAPSINATPAAERADVRAAKDCVASSTLPCRHSKGLLWKIERAGDKASYLFGTIHVSDPRVTTLPQPVQQAFDTAQSFTMEVIVDGAGLTHMAESMFFNDQRTLESTIGKERYAEIRHLFEVRKLPLNDLNKKKPWVIEMMLSTPAQAGLPLDFQLQLRATLQGKPTYGLENIRDQIAVFDELPMADQVSMLEATLRYYRDTGALIEQMVQAYVARDLVRIMGLMDAPPGEDRRLHEAVMERLLANRNVLMVQHMRARLDEGNAFIAVGAGHLAGPRGLLMLLEQNGYRVSPVY